MQETVTEKLNQARILKKQFKLDETIEVLKECIEMDPSCLIAVAQAGLCLLLVGKPAEAAPFLEKAFNETQKKDIIVGAYLAAALTAIGETERANEVLADIRSDKFSAAETYMLVAEMLAEKKSFEEALRLIDALSVNFAEDPFFVPPINHYRMIRVLADCGVSDIAKQLSEALTQNAPDCWEALAAQSSVAIAEGKYEEAYSLTIRALQNGGASYPLLAAQQHWLAINK